MNKQVYLLAIYSIGFSRARGLLKYIFVGDTKVPFKKEAFATFHVFYCFEKR